MSSAEALLLVVVWPLDKRLPTPPAWESLLPPHTTHCHTQIDLGGGQGKEHIPCSRHVFHYLTPQPCLICPSSLSLAHLKQRALLPPISHSSGANRPCQRLPEFHLSRVGRRSEASRLCLGCLKHTSSSAAATSDQSCATFTTATATTVSRKTSEQKASTKWER